MKKILLLAIMLCGVLSHTFAQKSFVYQAIVRDANQAVVSNQQVAVRISILDNDSVCYKELQSVKTNAFGNITLKVGTGNAVSGSFDAVPWSKMNLNIGLEFDLQNGSNFGQIVIGKINAVPYALYAAQYPKAIQADGKSTGSLFSVVNANGDVVFEITENGAAVYIDVNDSKAAKSAFAVRGRSGAKSTEDILVINNDGTTVYVDNDESKAAKSAFAVRGRDGAKSGNESFVVDANGTVVYIDGDDSKAAKSAFAVRGRSGAKSDVTFKIDGNGTVIYVNTDETKAAKSAFAVRGRSGAKSNYTNTPSTASAKSNDDDHNYFTISPDSTRIYLNNEATFAIAKIDEPQVQLMYVSTDSVTFTVDEVIANENVSTEDGEIGTVGFAKEPNLKLSSSEHQETAINMGTIKLEFDFVRSIIVPSWKEIAQIQFTTKIKHTENGEIKYEDFYSFETETKETDEKAIIDIFYDSSITQYADEEDFVTIVIMPIICIGTTIPYPYKYKCDEVEYKIKVISTPQLEYVYFGEDSYGDSMYWATTNLGAFNCFESGNEYSLDDAQDYNNIMPTSDMFYKLLTDSTNYKWEIIDSSHDDYYEKYNETYGYKVTYKTNDNSIFFPATIYLYDYTNDCQSYYADYAISQTSGQSIKIVIYPERPELNKKEECYDASSLFIRLAKKIDKSFEPTMSK